MTAAAYFVDAKDMAKQYPETFGVPSQSDLAHIQPGDCVKVCANESERFWVDVLSVEGEAITGTVNNDLLCTDEHGLNCGDTINFEKRHIYSVMARRGSVSAIPETGLEPLDVSVAARQLVDSCHGLARQCGWWDESDPNTSKANPLHFSNKLCLIHSEISEAMEGDRKGLMDDKLPHRQMREVELADAVIRIFDLAGGYDMDIAGAIAEKLAYNAQRADHKPENRKAEGGKAY